MKKKIIVITCLIMIIFLFLIGIKQIFFSKTENKIYDAVAQNSIYNNEITNLVEDYMKEGTNQAIESDNDKTSNVTEKNTNEIKVNNTNTTSKEKDIPIKGIFNKYEKQANQKLKSMTIDEKIGQILLVRFPNSGATEALKQYKFGGYIFFAKDFTGKTKQQVKDRMDGLQKATSIPILTAVDEEGGNVVRISSNPNLAKEKFKSPMELYKIGGFDKIKEDTIEKSELLKSLGINLNLAPVVDVCTSPSDYMYKRSLGQTTELTSTFAKTVINASKGTQVSYTLKHFPGYGNNTDTHTGESIDKRSYEDILKNDIPPFVEGINYGAESILVSHNTVTSIDKDNPASLSKKVHDLLRNDLSFTGIIITDDLDMGAVSNDKNATVKALQAGNDLIITTNYKDSINSIKKALQEGKITEETLNNAVIRVLAWKYYKGLM